MIGSECYGYGSIKVNNTTKLPPRTHRNIVLFFYQGIVAWDFESVRNWWFDTSDKWREWLEAK
jgi:hypothetical protein